VRLDQADDWYQDVWYGFLFRPFTWRGYVVFAAFVALLILLYVHSIRGFSITG
jgi:hypothetical protein